MFHSPTFILAPGTLSSGSPVSPRDDCGRDQTESVRISGFGQFAFAGSVNRLAVLCSWFLVGQRSFKYIRAVEYHRDTIPFQVIRGSGEA